MKPLFQVGDSVADMIVIATRREKGRLLYVCKCSLCGGERAFRVTSLQERKDGTRPIACGCKPNGNWRGHGRVSGSYFYTLKENAKRRGIEVGVSLEEIAALFDAQGYRCAVTKIPISFEDGTASLDRIDSSKGYLVGNLWWVHKTINLMKNKLSLTEFKEWCRLVSSHSEPQP